MKVIIKDNFLCSEQLKYLKNDILNNKGMIIYNIVLWSCILILFTSIFRKDINTIISYSSLILLLIIIKALGKRKTIKGSIDFLDSMDDKKSNYDVEFDDSQIKIFTKSNEKIITYDEIVKIILTQEFYALFTNDFKVIIINSKSLSLYKEEVINTLIMNCNKLKIVKRM